MMTYHTLSHFIPHIRLKIDPSGNSKFSTQTPKNFITSSHSCFRLITPYRTLFPIFDRNLLSVTTLNLVPRLLKILAHLATSYHVLSNLITLSPSSLKEK